MYKEIAEFLALIARFKISCAPFDSTPFGALYVFPLSQPSTCILMCGATLHTKFRAHRFHYGFSSSIEHLQCTTLIMSSGLTTCAIEVISDLKLIYKTPSVYSYHDARTKARNDLSPSVNFKNTILYMDLKHGIWLKLAQCTFSLYILSFTKCPSCQ